MEANWRNTNDVIAEIEVPLDDVCRKGAEMIARDARAKVPVDTGTLKRQIDVKESKFKAGGWIVVAQGSDNYSKFYASFIEFGANKTRKIPAQPYLRPAIKRNRPKIQKLWQESLGS